MYYIYNTMTVTMTLQPNNLRPKVESAACAEMDGANAKQIVECEPDCKCLDRTEKVKQISRRYLNK